MKKIFLFSSIILTGAIVFAQNSIGIGTTTPNSSAILDISSTSKGLLIPRLSTVQKNAIANPVTGLMVYDTDSKGLFVYNGTAWTNGSIGGVQNGAALPIDTTGNFYGLFNISNTNANINTYTMGLFNKAGSAILARSDSSNAINASSYHATGAGVIGKNLSTTGGYGVYGLAGAAGTGVYGTASGNGNAVWGNNTGSGYGIRGYSETGVGIYGKSNGSGTSIGVFGHNINGRGVYALTSFGVGVMSEAVGTTGVAAKFVQTFTSGKALEVVGNVKISGGNTNPSNGAILTSDAEGNAVWKNIKVAFLEMNDDINVATGSIGHNTSSTLTFGAEEHDYSNSYAAGVFTAPVSGLYHFGGVADFFMYDLNDNITFADISFSVNHAGSYSSKGRGITVYGKSSTSSWANASMNADIKLSAGDTVAFTGIQRNSAGGSVSWYGKFFGHLVFAD